MRSASGARRSSASLATVRALASELADPATSSSHARLTRLERGWVIADDGSKNGTLVNGRRVTRAELGPDDL